MTATLNEIKPNQFVTDDLAFSAYLKMQGFQLVKLNQNKSKSTFTFDLGKFSSGCLKIEFANSDYLNFYNEVRNLKKLL